MKTVNRSRKTAIFIVLAAAAAAVALAFAVYLILAMHDKKAAMPAYYDSIEIEYVFEDNGQDYAVYTAKRNQKRTMLILCSNSGVYRVLPGSGTLYSAQDKCLVYTDGKRLCRCDADLTESTVICKLSGKGDADLLALGDGCAVVRMQQGADGKVSAFGASYLIEIASGAVYEFQLPDNTIQSSLCIKGGQVYYCSGSAGNYTVSACTVSIDTTANICSGRAIGIAVADGECWFYNYDAMYRVPAGGGEPELVDLGGITPGSITALAQRQGKLLIAAVDEGQSGSDPVLSAVLYDPADGSCMQLLSAALSGMYGLEIKTAICSDRILLGSLKGTSSCSFDT